MKVVKDEKNSKPGRNFDALQRSASGRDCTTHPIEWEANPISTKIQATDPTIVY